PRDCAMRPETSRLSAALARQVHLGTTSDGNDIFVSLDELKRTSCHVVGASGYGKSYFLRNLIRHFLRYGQPFGLVDPHRDLFDNQLTLLEAPEVLNIDNGPLRAALRERVSDPWIREDW